MRLPNGYGSVHKLPGKRHNPWTAKVTTGWEIVNDECRQVQKYIGYFATRSEALQSLSDYNDNPYDLDSSKITFAELYNKWSNDHFKKISESRIRGIRSAYGKCEALYRLKFKNIKATHLDAVTNNPDIGQATRQQIKSLFNQLYKYAMKNDIVRKDYSSLMDPVRKYEREKKIKIFTSDEITILWNNLDIENVDIILIAIYSGCRPGELAELKTSNVDMENETLIGGIKTKNGIDRVIPIHPKIRDLIKNRLNTAGDTLFNLNYDQYKYSYKKAMKTLNMNHSPHETRHTFATRAKEVGMDEYCLKLIIGHAISDLTERVYTHRQIEQLRTEMHKITY